MADLFASANAVLRRAKHHIKDFEVAMEKFREGRPYIAIVEYDPGFGKHVLKARFIESIVEDLACIMFDGLNNLRACLDQMTDAIAIRYRGESKHFAQFPFAKDVAHWPARINGLKNHLPSEVMTLFGFFQPYKGGDNTLWAMNEIVNVKKHARLIPVGFGHSASIQFAGGRAPAAGEFISTPPHLYRKDEIVIMSLPEGHAVPEIYLSPTVVLNHPDEIVSGKQPIALLYIARDRVSSILNEATSVCSQLGLLN
jgi:hypothetical protein